MNQLEQTIAGHQGAVLLGFIDKGSQLFKAEDTAELAPCERCGQPTTGRFCAFCRARAQVLGERLGAPDDRRPAGRRTSSSWPASCPTRSCPRSLTAGRTHPGLP